MKICTPIMVEVFLCISCIDRIKESISHLILSQYTDFQAMIWVIIMYAHRKGHHVGEESGINMFLFSVIAQEERG